MKRTMLLAAGFAAYIAFASGCTLFQGNKIPTPQQLVTDFCPTVNADLKLLASSPLLNASQQQLLNGVPGDVSHPGIIAINAAVCAAGGQIDVTDIQTLNNTAFPALIGLVGALPMLPNQPVILLGLTLAQPILNQIAAQVLPETAAAPSLPTPAVTPAAASTPAAVEPSK